MSRAQSALQRPGSVQVSDHLFNQQCYLKCGSSRGMRLIIVHDIVFIVQAFVSIVTVHLYWVSARHFSGLAGTEILMPGPESSS